MWPRSKSANADHVGEYWDAFVRGAPQAELDQLASSSQPELIESISELHFADDSRLPSSAFMDRIEAQFSAVVQADLRLSNRPSNGLHAVPNIPTLPSATGHDVAAPVPLGLYHKSFLYAVAAAAMLAILIVGAYVAFFSQDDQISVADQQNMIPAPPREFEVPMDRGNPQRSGALPGPGVAENLAMRWQFPAGRGAMSAPALVGDTLFIAGGSELGSEVGSGSIVAIDFVTGSERWRFPTENAAATTPAVIDGIVYASDTGGNLYALEAETGHLLWYADLQGRWASAPVVADNLVFIATAPYQVSLHVAVGDGAVVVGSGLDGQIEGVRLHAFDPLTGKERWQSTDTLSGKPGLVAFDASNGEPTWNFPMSSLELGPAIGGQRVFAGSSLDRTVYALDLNSGRQSWQTLIGEDLPLYSSPAVAGGSVFVTTAFGKIVSLNESTGLERWRANAKHISLSSSAIVIDETVYVVDTVYGVSAISAADGSVLWSEQLELEGRVVVSPIILHGALFIGTSLTVGTEYVATLWAFTGTGDSDPDAGESS